MKREIIYSEEFDKSVALLGGYRFVDEALEAVLEPLSNDPFVFKVIENDYFKVRYVKTKKVKNIPPLLIIFKIDENKNVILEYIEEDL